MQLAPPHLKWFRGAVTQITHVCHALVMGPNPRSPLYLDGAGLSLWHSGGAEVAQVLERLRQGDVGAQRRERAVEAEHRSMRAQALRERGRSSDLDFPIGVVVRDRLEMSVAGQDRRRRLRAPSRDAGNTVGVVAHKGQPVRN